MFLDVKSENKQTNNSLSVDMNDNHTRYVMQLLHSSQVSNGSKVGCLMFVSRFSICLNKSNEGVDETKLLLFTPNIIRISNERDEASTNRSMKVTFFRF